MRQNFVTRINRITLKVVKFMFTRRRVYMGVLFSVLGLLALGSLFPLAPEPPETITAVVAKTKPSSLNQVAENPRKTNTESVEEEFEENFLNESLVQQIGDFVEYYETQSRYPVYSIPISDPESVEIPKLFEETEVETPLFDEDGGPLSLSIKAAVDKFEYTIGEAITLRVKVQGLEDNQTVSATATIKKIAGQTLSQSPIQLSQLGSESSQLTATFQSNSFNTGFELGDIIAAVSVNIDGQAFSTTVPLRLNKTVSGRLENLGVAQVDGAFLNIPLQFSVTQSGYFFVQAYLFDQITQRPLLSLQSEGRMEQGNDYLNLRAHHHSLKDAGSQGPYTLKVHRAFRSAQLELNEVVDVPVTISSANYFVPDFEFGGYANDDYVDPETRRRIEALRELSANTQLK